jgi:hypothetical protein
MAAAIEAAGGEPHCRGLSTLIGIAMRLDGDGVGWCKSSISKAMEAKSEDANAD